MPKRILKSEKYLSQLLASGDGFYVGIPYEDALKTHSLEGYGLPKAYNASRSYIPLARRSVSRVNVKGKYIRKIPEEKTEKHVDIKYTKKNGTRVEFTRIFYVYVKELQHKLNIALSFITNEHSQKLIISPLLTFHPEDYTSNITSTHVINLFLEIFGSFEVYTTNLDPALAFNKEFTFELLPKGSFENDDIEYVLEGSRRFLKKDEDVQAFQQRLLKIQSYNPEIIGKGPNAFFGYIVFGFPKKDIVLLESMYRGNATYVVDYDTYEKIIPMNKQQIINGHLAKRRMYHWDNWERAIEKLLK